MSVLLQTKSRAQWRAQNPVLGEGEMVYEKDTLRLKVGDGVSPYITLPYAWIAYVIPGTVTQGDPTYYDAIVVNGVAVVADNVMPPGIRVESAWTLEFVNIRAGTAPAGSDLEVVVRANGNVVGTYSLPDGSTSITIPSTWDFSAADIVTFDVVAVGSDTPGSDVAVTLY